MLLWIFFAALLWGLGCYFIGYGIARKRPVAPKHEHIWAPWEFTAIARWSDNQKKLVNVYGQKRNCLDCNYEERETITALGA